MQEINLEMDISKKLNEEQYLAASHLEGPLLVLAGAGSGKTRCVTYRIVNLLQNGVSPRAILGLTFTNKAAKEMTERVNSLTRQYILISTFHSLGTRILRESIQYLGYSRNFNIYDTDDSEKLIKECLAELNLQRKTIEPKTIKHLIGNAKNNLLGPSDVTNDFPESEAEKEFPRVYQLYQKKLKEYNAVDFDDLLFLPVLLFMQFPECLEYYQNIWQFLLIDEYQDTNYVQYELVKMLVQKSRNIFVVGDPDQSIYSWRGADINNILNFEKDFPGSKVVYLEQNYRSTQIILDASNELIKNNSQRYEKKLWSAKTEGELIKKFMGNDEHDEGRFVADKIRYYHNELNIPLKEIVVFYRTNFQSRVIEDHLLQKKIPYVIIGGISFYQRQEIKDLLSYLKIIASPWDYISFARSINIPKRGLGNTTVDKLKTFASQENLSIIDLCKKLVAYEIEDPNFRLSKKQIESLRDYLLILHELDELKESTSISILLRKTIESIHYLSYLKNDPETFLDRNANIDELISKAEEWEENVENPNLENFLEEMSLKNHHEVSDHEDSVNLMTLHNGKGLEFKVVFIIGVENELLPHANSRGSYYALEEERRLLYVGMTRAKEYLYLSSVQTRHMWGQNRIQRASRFLDEIPSQYIEKVSYAIGRHRQIAPRQKFPLREESEDESRTFKVGDAVFHNDFGIGIVKKSYTSSLGEMADVIFSKDNMTKSLAIKYARLKKL